ncbi:glycoside hydrolase family 99-like domain-containing protein [Butyrivibrio sp. AE2032]|uniref:glycoside hydrolase family 99-like domain-containing protein n=1 Tax=Butyrivibrio sp. AE2032 TaxID=1458463 RepID=UPI00068BE820|nr:glycoside hydrolase family 99-like domain-containing protein [Butyrivibrio sp. AE2032]
MKTKTIVMYLPQFHRTQDNDKWWGEGFTEWTAVRDAEPLFEGHRQPRVPEGQNYYNLLDKTTLQRQAELMKNYGIDGACFYHYYFKAGRMTLEKPAENLLKWKDIDMPFCFSWANDRWARTWSKISGNSWADKYEIANADEPEVLLEQKYGRETEWKAHFEYLLPFFMDDRYIRIEDKPVFLFHSPEAISCLYAMIEYWRKLAKDCGMKGLYLISVESNYSIKGTDAALYLAPHRFWKILETDRTNGVLRPDFDEIWKNILSTKTQYGRKTFFGAVADCDDTPRRGVNGVSIKGYSSRKFEEYMTALYKKSQNLGNELVFINAWNEWGEGMYLEPDEHEGYAKLMAVKNAQEHALEQLKIDDVKLKESDFVTPVITEDKVVKRYRLNALCFEKWVSLLENNTSIASFLLKNEIKHVAIYGMGAIGKHMINELRGSEVQIDYIIDQRYMKNSPEHRIVSPESDLQEVDAIIVTSLWDYENIYEKLRSKCDYRIISAMELVDELC